MGFFFRKSVGAGLFRLNFSKSGLGASVGVKGARLTLTPTGTTYITVGTHGFYYRETISSGKSTHGNRLPPPPSTCAASDEIPTAHIADLIDSSSAALVRSLNERAAMFNPAWILYLAAIVVLLIGIVTPSESSSRGPALPLAQPTSYVSLVARYGYPNSVLATSMLHKVP